MEHRTLVDAGGHARAASFDPATNFTAQLAYIGLTPVLALWPLLSTLPVFGLIAGPPSIGWGVMHLFLLISGFWGVFGAWATLRFIRPASVSAQAAPHTGIMPRGTRGLALGAYATVWTIVAMGVVILGVS
ncbi:hypothetical protein [Salinarimonas ramus]|uniref:Uncharacterized protein n=1 Tax=Salinarimonas ramus TaxID=690164 RepID=A0A917V285_9HYPH|nr:hypothetical protein [Salinarimonas ramus]GGK26283.1 hypothetical protein GCM10011322_10820 [Salinarimonas ramus]